MLGRTAASLFWMSRYVERAENMARLLEVGYRVAEQPARPTWKPNAVWRPPTIS